MHHLLNAPFHRLLAPATLALAALAPAQAALLSSPASSTTTASTELLINGSFEGAVTGSYCYLSACGPLTGWTGNVPVMQANSGAWGTPGTMGGYAYGNQLVGLQNGSHIEQVLNLVAGLYQLTWADAGRAGYHATQYNVLFDDTVLNGAPYGTLPGQAWSGHSLQFTAGGSGALRFQGLAVSPDGTAFIDGLSLTRVASQVPEPASLALVLTAALLGWGAARQARRAQRAR